MQLQLIPFMQGSRYGAFIPMQFNPPKHHARAYKNETKAYLSPTFGKADSHRALPCKAKLGSIQLHAHGSPSSHAKPSTQKNDSMRNIHVVQARTMQRQSLGGNGTAFGQAQMGTWRSVSVVGEHGLACCFKVRFCRASAGVSFFSQLFSSLCQSLFSFLSPLNIP